MKRVAAILACLAAIVAVAQTRVPIVIETAPPTGGTCDPTRVSIVFVRTTGDSFFCNSSNQWEQLPGGAGGSGNPGGDVGDLQWKGGATTFSGTSGAAVYSSTAGELRAKRLNRVRYAHMYATSGTGTDADPWVTSGSNPIQAAMDDLPAAGGKIVVPAGTYTLGTGANAVIVDQSHVEIVGDGQGASILKYGGSGTAIKFDGTGAAIGNVALRHLTVRATAAGTGPLVFADTVDNTIVNLGYIFEIEDVEIDGGTNNVDVGLRLQDVQNASIRGVTLFDFDTDATDTSVIIDADSLNRGNITLEDIIMSRVQIGVDLNVTGVALLNNINFHNVKFVNSVSTPASSVGIRIPANVESIPIVGCHFERLETGVSITGGKAVDIRGSLFGIVTTGVNLVQNTRSVIVQGNRFASVTTAVDIGATNNFYALLGPNYFGASVTTKYNGITNGIHTIVDEDRFFFGTGMKVQPFTLPDATNASYIAVEHNDQFGDALRIWNMDASNSEDSPRIHFRNGGTNREDEDVRLGIDNAGAFRVYEDGGGTAFKVDQSGNISIGEGADANIAITFDQGTGTDPTIIWNDSGAQLETNVPVAVTGQASTSTCFRVGGASGPRWCSGSGAPAGVDCDAAGELGSLYSRTDATAVETPHLYVCSEDSGGNPAWEAVQ